MTFQELTKRVQHTLGLEDITANDEVALAKAYLNEGIIDILSRTRPYTRVIQLTLTGGVKIHDMSNTILALLDLQYGDTFLERMSREDVSRAQLSGAKGFAYEEPLLWVSPVPRYDTTFLAYGVFRPAPLSADDDDPASPAKGGLAPEFHPAIVNYALWKAGEYVQHEQSGGGERWRIMYEGQDGTGGDIARIKRILAKRVTPQGTRRRDLSRHIGILSPSGSYNGG
jgi:hypothetical protein